MKKFSLYLVLPFLINIIQTQRPKNIRIFNAGDIYKHGKLFYEYTVLKMKFLLLNLKVAKEQVIIGTI